jgi:hypothetical protein
MVLALDLIDNLLFEENIRLDLIVERLSILSKHWLLVEYIPYEGQQSCEISAAQYSWYTLDNFIDELQKKFRSAKIIPSQSKSRIFLLCEK